MKPRHLLALAPLLVLGSLAWPASAQSTGYTAVVREGGHTRQVQFTEGTHRLFEGGGWQCMARVVGSNLAAIGCRQGGDGFSAPVNCREADERSADVMVFQRGRDEALVTIELRCR